LAKIVWKVGSWQLELKSAGEIFLTVVRYSDYEEKDGYGP